MVHGIEVPTIRHGNTLARPLRDYGPADQVDVIVTNPPFGGMEEDGIETNFPAEFRTRETADLFLVLVMELCSRTAAAPPSCCPTARCSAKASRPASRKTLLDECNLHTIVRLPNGVFAPYTDIRTNILFFDRNGPTKETWYYEVTPPSSGGKFTKTQPITDADFEPVRRWWSQRETDERSWMVPRSEVDDRPYLNLDIQNPTQRDSRVSSLKVS